MAGKSDRMQEFIDTQGRDLFDVLTSRGQEVGPGAEDPAGCCYDLMEIAAETQKLFNETIPAVLAARDADIDTLQDAWWDVYFAFHHINYHIHATLWPED